MTELIEEKIEPREIEEEMKTAFIDYAMSVIVGRALPDARDGLKPVHRRILYGMYEMGLHSNKPYKKCARIVGDVMGKYHPHGDSAIYDALARLAQDFSCRATLIEGHGNFGSVDGDPPAAMRYTEARLSKIAAEMLRDIDKETVSFIPNYDDTEQEPSVLPARYPNLLVNGSEGIAVGMATKILPHNLREVVEGAIYRLENPDCTIEDLMKLVKGPDFPTGGIILGRKGIEDAFRTGRGSVRVRGVAEIEEAKNGRFRIAVTELPYQVNKSKLAESIAMLVREKKIEGISDLRDESDRRGMRLVIELKRDSIPQVVLNNIYKQTTVQTSFGMINLALVDGVPRVLSLIEILDHYLSYQKEIITKRTIFDLKKAEERMHILEGLLVALSNLDEVIKTIRASANPEEARAKLVEKFKLSEIQAQAILDMRLQRLTALERDKIEAEHAELVKVIAELKAILSDPAKIAKIIKEEMSEISEKYGTDRKTRISEAEGDIDVEDLIPEEDVVVTVTQTGYIKRVQREEFRAQKRGGKGVKAQNVKEGDIVDQLFYVSTHDWLLVFTNKGKVYKIKVHSLPRGERTARGQNIVNLLPFAQGEKFRAAIAVQGFSEDKFITMATERGLIKKTSLREFENIQKNGIISIRMKESDSLVKVRLTSGQDNILIVTCEGKSIKFSESDVRPIGRATSGVMGIRLKGLDKVISFDIAEDNSSLFVITDQGIGKRTKISKYPLQGRAGSGVKTIKLKKGTCLAGARVVVPGEQILLVTEAGILINVLVDDMSELSRDTQGVKVMNVGKKDRISTIAVISDDEEIDPLLQQKLEV